MKLQDILFLPYFLVWFYDKHSPAIIIYTTFIFLIIQIMLSLKYKLDSARQVMIVLLIVSIFIGFIAMLPGNGTIKASQIIWLILSPFLYLFVFVIYVGMFIVNPLYIKIKNYFNKRTKQSKT